MQLLSLETTLSTITMTTVLLVACSSDLAAAELSLEQLQEQAKQGDPAAQLSLAIRYRDAKGVAKDDAAAAFYERYGFMPLSASEGRMFLPMKTVAALFLQ